MSRAMVRAVARASERASERALGGVARRGGSTRAGDADDIVDVEGALARARARSKALEDANTAANVRAMTIFDRDVVRAHRDRSAFLQGEALKSSSGRAPDGLLDELARRLLDRLRDIKRDFRRVVVLGGACEAITRRLLLERDDVEKIVVVDLSQDMLNFVARVVGDSPTRKDGAPVEIIYVQGDEENLPIRGDSVDAVVSCLGLHWVNDLPGAMSSAAAALVPDGLFLSCIFGGNTLQELRVACALAETEHDGGVSARVSPLAHVRDCGSLLGRANLTLPAVDVDIVNVGYSSPEKLVEHLRVMGETNAGVMRRKFLPRVTAAAASTIYSNKFPASTSGEAAKRVDGADAATRSRSTPVEATFEVLYMTGWRSHSSQQTAKSRGSATVSLRDLEHLNLKSPAS